MTRREFYERLWMVFRQWKPASRLWREYVSGLNVQRVKHTCRVTVVIGEPGTSWHRVWPALLELVEDPDLDIVVEEFQTSEPELAKSDVCWFQRPMCETAMDQVHLCKKLIVELDDDFDNISPSNPCFSLIKSGKDKLMRDMFAQADVCAFSTQHLANVYQSCCKNQVVWPNLVDPDLWQPLPGPRLPEGTICIGFSGSEMHHVNLAIVEDALAELMVKYKNIWFAASGVIEGSWISKLPRERVLSFPMDYGPPFQSRLTQMFDIGIAPLEDTLFNRSKSGLRLLEYAWHDKPAVCSSLTTYITDGVPCMVASNEDEWYSQLSKLIDDSEVRRLGGFFGGGYVREYCMMKNHVHKWKEVLVS